MAFCSSCGKELTGEPVFCPFCGAALAQTAASTHERRKVVSVVFCDVTGSTALGERLDPESLRAVMARYFEAMKIVIERHGGTVEKFVGDAVMAVFGVPVLHEDDALRALRAVSEMRAALVGLNAELVGDYGTALELRIGVNSGEVVTGTDERLVTGDAVNVAARLEQAAEPGEILLGHSTLGLAGDAVVAEPLAPLELKGKSEPVLAWRLVSVSADAPERRSGSALVGREPELRTLLAAWERARVDRRCELVTVIGDAGVGKSRLVAEFLTSVDADVVRGRCLSYGEGITYWPVVEVVKQLEGRLPDLDLDPAVNNALHGLLANIETTSTDEIAWAFRKLLETVAATRPLIAVFDDIQWGGEAFLDLLEHLVYVSSGAAILVCCMARPALLDQRAGWAGVLHLEPLDPDQAGQLIDARLAAAPLEPGVRDRIMAASGGNPLFVEELTTMLQTSGDGQLTIPGTIQALLSARLDQLDPAERAVLERAAVEGEVFHRGSVQSLMPEETHLTTRLTSLVRKELIRPDNSYFAGDDAFRFRHLLIRDAAYDSLAKATRAELHERFADWVETRGRDLVEVDEIVGYHLEQAHRYLGELRPADAHTRLLAQRSAERITSAGRRANTRGDMRATIALLGRAASLLSTDEPSRPELLAELGIALVHAQELERADAVVTEALEAAQQVGDSRTEAYATLAFVEVKWRREGVVLDEAETQRAIRIFEQCGDERGLARGWHLIGRTHEVRYEETAARKAFERALTYARNAGDVQQEGWLRIVYGHSLLYGPTPLAEVNQYQQETLAWAKANHNPRGEAAALALEGRLRAMQGDFVEARVLIAQGRARFEELGITMAVLGSSIWSGEVEEHAGDLAAAEAHWRAYLSAAEETRDNDAILWCGLEIARIAHLRGHHDGDDRVRAIYEETADSDEPYLQVARRLGFARVMARQGQTAEAVRLAHEALALAASPDSPLDRGASLIDAAATLSVAGHHTEALSLAEEALDLYQGKGDVAMAARVQKQLDAFNARAGAAEEP